jgi:hypothetical protein
MAEKRKFPYYSAVASFSVSGKRQDVGRGAGTEATDTPIFEQPNYGVDNYGDPRVGPMQSCLQFVNGYKHWTLLAPIAGSIWDRLHQVEPSRHQGKPV